MLYPSLFGENLFDDFMDFSFPTFRGLEDVDRKLYGKHAPRLMKTDVHEKDEQYEIDIDLPGFKKDEITLTLEKGTLTVAASKGLDKDEKNDKGRVIRQERYAGSMQRSFFVGRNVTEIRRWSPEADRSQEGGSKGSGEEDHHDRRLRTED